MTDQFYLQKEVSVHPKTSFLIRMRTLSLSFLTITLEYTLFLARGRPIQGQSNLVSILELRLLFRVCKSDWLIIILFPQMWMNVLRTRVRTVQNAPISTETIHARAAVLSLERTVTWVRKLLICHLYSILSIMTYTIHWFFTLSGVVPLILPVITS